MKKKICAVLLSVGVAAAVMLSACGQKEAESNQQEEAAPVEAEETAEEQLEQPAVEAPEGEMPSSIRVYGQVKEINEGTILIENTNEDEQYQQIVLNVSEETLILDAAGAEEKTIEDIKNAETLYAYVSPAMTRSIPPMSNAEVIFCGIKDELSVPEYADIVSVEEKEDGSVSLTTNRDIIYHVNNDVEILDFATGEKLTVSALKEGSRVLAWYQIVLQSFPAQTTPSKMMVFQ